MASDKTQPVSRKLNGWELYHQVLGSPKYVVAPMVDQSELAWRILSRRYGAQVAYTPMINAKNYTAIRNKSFREANFSIANGEEGNSKIDRPLIIQFCGNDPDQILQAAKMLEAHCDAVDINLGCPQDIAKKGKYGAFLQEDWDLIYRIINTLHVNLSIPVTAKFRVYPTVEKTVEYAKMLERAGAQILTCHGRTREQRGVLSGLADWSKIKAVKDAVSVPVFANGNILYFSDIAACLESTGADAIMSAEGNLYNPALFRPSLLPSTGTDELDPSLEHIPHVDLALEYLQIVKEIKTPTEWGAIKGHLFKMLRPGLAEAVDLRNKLGRVYKAKERVDNLKAEPGSKSFDILDGIAYYEGIVLELKERMEKDALAAKEKGENQIRIDPINGRRIVPHWLSQPYFRPPPPPPPANKRLKKDIKDYLESRMGAKRTGEAASDA